MRHWKARRLLPDLLDGTLSAPLEARLHSHLDDCRRCRRVFAELQECDQLLALLPASLVPLEASAGTPADARLRALSRWAVAPAPTWQERVGFSALAAFAAAAMIAMTLSSAGWVSHAEPSARPVYLAAIVPDARLFPTGIRR